MEKPKFTIVGIAPQPIQEALLNLKKQFNLSFDTTEIPEHYVLKDNAHYAIKRTFYLKPGISEEDVVKKIKELSLSKKIQIDCTSTGIFPGTAYGDILYIKINMNQDLKNLHNELITLLSDLVETKNTEMEGENYTPHLSMVYNIPKEITDDVNIFVENNILPIQFELEELLFLKDFDTQKDERQLVYRHRLD